MSQNDKKRLPDDRKGSVSPELKHADVGWDDDAPLSFEMDASEDDDAFDRVTAIPDIPGEVLARKLMERAEREARRNAAPQQSTRPPPRSSSAVHPEPLTLDLENDHLYEPDHEEPTLKVDQPGLQRRSAMRSDPGPLLSFEFTPATSDDRTLAAHDSEESGDAPPRRRERLPTRELMLELDDSHPNSALELAENAPAVERTPHAHESLEPPDTTRSAAEARRTPAHSDMKDRYAMGDFTGALVAAEAILEVEPHDDDALRCAERCRDVLTQMYTARLGPLTQIVTVVIPNDEIRWLSLDHRTGFLLSLVDGSLTLEEILDISGMSRLDALRLMYTLLDQRVISLS